MHFRLGRKIPRWIKKTHGESELLEEIGETEEEIGGMRSFQVACSRKRKEMRTQLKINEEKVEIKRIRAVRIIEAANICNEELICFSHATREGRYTRRTIPTLLRVRWTLVSSTRNTVFHVHRSNDQFNLLIIPKEVPFNI